VAEQLLATREGLAGPTADAAPRRESIEPAHLQIVMLRLWEEDVTTHKATIRLSTLRRLGGAGEIVRGHLDRTMDMLSANERAAAADAFRYLVTPSGAKVRYLAEDLATYTGRPAIEVEALLERLSASDMRVLRPTPWSSDHDARPAYELFHDMLAEGVRAWRARFIVERLERRARRLRTALVAVAVVGAVCAVHAFWRPSALRRLELSTVDLRFVARGNQRPDRDVVIVAIDDATVRQVGGYPVPRDLQARVLNDVYAAHPRLIAFDVIFKGRTPHDRPLIEAIHRARSKVVLAASRFAASGADIATEPLFGFADFGATAHVPVAYAGMPEDPGGVLRRLDFDAALRSKDAARPLVLQPLAVASAGNAVPRRPPTAPRSAWRHQSTRTTWIDFHGHAGSTPTVSFVDVLDGRVDRAVFLNRTVLIGASTPLAGDMHRTSVTSGEEMPGVEVQANAISTLRRGIPLRDAGLLVDLSLIALLGLVPIAAVTIRQPLLRAGCIALAAVVFTIGAQVAFDEGRIVPVVAPLLALVAACIAVTAAGRIQPGMRAKRSAATRHAGFRRPS
jgi:CHASE2 domain-containing sensor protein